MFAHLDYALEIEHSYMKLLCDEQASVLSV